MKKIQAVKSINADKIEGTTRYIIGQLLCFMLGALSASINELGTVSPFAVSLVAAVGRGYTVSSGLGAAAGYILTQDNLSALRYIAAIACCVVMIRLVEQFEITKKFRLMPSCVAFMSLFLTSMAVLFASEVSIRTFLLFLCEATLGFALSYFFASAKDAIFSRERQGGFSIRDIAVISILANVFLLSLSDISLYGVSFARIISILALLFFSYIYKESGGAVYGISASLVLSLNKGIGALGITYAISGLIAGLFSYFNRYIATLTFFISYLMVFVFENGTGESLYFVIEAVLACTIFVCIPEKYIKLLGSLFYASREPQALTSHRQAVLEKLKNVSVAVSDVSSSVNAASQILKQREPLSELDVYSKVRESVCKNCRLNNLCWNKNFKDCKKAFDQMSETLKDNGMVNQRNLPKYLVSCCTKTSEIADSFNKNYINYVSSRSAKEKIEKIRSITSLQFGGICDMLSEMSQEFTEEMSFDDSLCAEIEEMLINDFNIRPITLVCIYDENGKLKIEFSFYKKSEKLNEYELRQSLQAVSRVKLDRPSVINQGEAVNVCFCEKTRYRVEASAARIVANKDKYCGDSFESFYDGKGNYVVVLSDGMGTGMRAAVDSSLASSMMAKLLRSGFSHNAALRVVNSALMLKSTEESLATLDIMSIDLYTGNAKLYKAGATTTLVKKRGIVSQVNRASMPAGILEETEFAQANLRLRKDDIIVMASDGAFEYSESSAKSILSLSNEEEDIETLAEKIASRSKQERNGKPSDDITVIAVKLVTNE